VGTYSDAGKQLDQDLSDISGRLTSLSAAITGTNDAVTQLAGSTKQLADAIITLDARLKVLENAKPTDPVPPGISCAPPNMAGPGAEPTGASLTSAGQPSASITLTKKMDAFPANNGLTFGKVNFKDPDCNRPGNYPVYDYYLGGKPTSLQGTSADDSILELPANSLSQGYRSLDTINTPDTNPYYIVRTDNAKLIQDLTVKGNTQGTSPKNGKPYSFHGWQLYGTTDPTLRRVRFIDISGSEGVPPNETFAVFGYNITGTYTVEDCEFLGKTLEGASAISCMAKGTLKVILRRIKVQNYPNGSGWTIFNTTISSFLAEDFATDNAMSGLNFEQLNVNGGAKVNNAVDSGVVLNRLDIRNPSGRISGYSHISVDSSQAGSGVSNRFDIHDPIGITESNKFGVCISNGYGFANVPKGPQAQRGADIHLWMGNTERNDLLWFTRTSGAA
jgi:hypothetical protein